MNISFTKSELKGILSNSISLPPSSISIENDTELVDYFIEFGDKIRIQHHRKGGFTPRHIDNSISQNPPKQKIPYHPYERFLEAGNANISAVLYLNDNYKGGEFYILDKEYYAEKGSIIVFPSGFMYPHGVRKVTEGERWSISIFLR